MKHVSVKGACFDRSMLFRLRRAFGALICLLIVASSFAVWPPPALAAGTTSINIIKYASDRSTILDQTTIDWTTMQSTLPIHGDGVTHYYMEGPNFTGDMWDANETGNLKDRGAVMGTDLKDLCNLVGGMSPGDTMQVRSYDGWHLDGPLPYSNVYDPADAQGPIVLCWYTKGTGVDGGDYPDGAYVPDFAEGIRLAFMPTVPNAAGLYVFGDYDMQQYLPSSCWHYFYQGGTLYPSVNGLSGKNISEVDIYSTTPASTPTSTPTPEPTPTSTPTPVSTAPPGGGGGSYLPPVSTFTPTPTPTSIPTPTATSALTPTSIPTPTATPAQNVNSTPELTPVKTIETPMSTQTAAPTTSSAQSVVQVGATTSVHIVKYAADGTTVLSGRTVDYKWMGGNLPVQGDGVTHYYLQGPVFQGDMWDPDETTNLKDKGAVKGTDIKDLCDLVGGMSPGDEVMLVAVDGYYLEFPYENVYEPQDRQGPIVLCWYKGEDPESSVGYGYPGNNAYSSAMQIVFLAKTTNQYEKHVFGNSDMLACLTDKKYQHFYEGLPSTDGLSAKWISEIRIYPAGAPVGTPIVATPQTASESTGAFPVIPLALGCAGLVLVGTAGVMYFINRKSVNKV